jgi:hypothetical protein
LTNLDKNEIKMMSANLAAITDPNTKMMKCIDGLPSKYSYKV